MSDLNIDALVRTAVFGNDAAKADARKQIHTEARRRGAASSSIYDLYMAIGRGGELPLTAPAFNIPTLTDDTARDLFRPPMPHNIGPFIFEVARPGIRHPE